MSTNNFILVENFAWLIDNLESFPGGRIVNGKPTKFTYNKRGKRDANGNFLGPTGGKRRIYRRNNHIARGKYAVVKTSTVVVNFNSTKIECDEFLLYHADFYDKKLKEKYKGSTNQATSPEAEERVEKPDAEFKIDPATNLPVGGGNTGERVLVTSKESFKNKTAPRYYVSCTCKDFLYTFKEQLINHGYALGTVTTGTGKTGVKNFTGITICKHIYHVLKNQYADILKWKFEQTPVYNAAMMPWGLTPKAALPKKEKPSKKSEEVLPDILAPDKEEETTTITTSSPEVTKKEVYKNQIIMSLRHYNSVTSDRIAAYKSPKDAPKHYRKYKFMVRWYGKTWAIVFTNPDVNPETSEYKEIVPILDKTGRGIKISPLSPVKIYSYFTKDELLDLIRNHTKEIQQNQIDRVKSFLGIKPTTDDSSWLTENLEYPTNISSILKDLING